MSFVHDLKERKLVQWVLAYLAGAWLVWQVMDVLGERWGLTPGVGRAIDLLLVGLFVTLILAWYHGEQGRHRVSGPELTSELVTRLGRLVCDLVQYQPSLQRRDR